MKELTQEQVVRRTEIIKDIIKKRPDEHNCSYVEKEYYDFERNYSRTRMIPSKKFFGHCPIELWTLGLSENGYRLRETILDIFEKGTTQKQNRFNERITDDLLKYVSDFGIPGLYRVRTSTNSIGYVYAVSLEEAQRVADVSYGFVIAGKKDRWGDPESLRVAFNKQGTVGDLNVSNQSDVGHIRERIASAQEQIVKQRELITKYETDLMAIQMSELSQLGTLLDDEAA